jgi:BirA family biotin operon repressor/biotin-[acetyl-CoA-carboxylase] ligase
VEVLSIRVGIRAARSLDRFAAEPIRLKWPNDLYVAGGKLAGILVEARWREERLEWLAIGIGLNIAPPADLPGAAGLDPGTRRSDVLAEMIPGIRLAASATGELSPRELVEFDTRDMARGHRCVQPAQGTVRGITASGELVVALADTVARFRSGSLILERR